MGTCRQPTREPPTSLRPVSLRWPATHHGRPGAPELRRSVTLIAALALATGSLVAQAGPASAGPGRGPAPAATPGVIATVAAGTDPYGVAVDSTSHTVYVADFSRVVGIDESGDAGNGRVTTRTPISTPLALAVDPSDHHLYVVSDGNEVDVVDESGDAGTGTVTATIPVPEFAEAIAVDPTNHNVYVAVQNDADQNGTVQVIDESGDARTGTVTAVIPLAYAPSALAVDPGTHRVYAADYDNNRVQVIYESGAAHTGTVLATIPVGREPESVAVDPSNHQVYVASNVGTLSVIDGSGDAHDDKVIATLPVEPYPGGVAADPTTHDVYLTSPGNDVSVFDESGDADNGKVKASVGVGNVPETVAIDPSNSNVYVTNLWDNTMSVIAPPADLAMTVTGPSHAASRFSVTVTVADHGPHAARASTNLLIPPGLTVISAPGASLDHGTLVWAAQHLAAGASVTYHATLAVAAGVHGTVQLGGVTTGAATYDPDPADNAAFLTVRLG